MGKNHPSNAGDNDALGSSNSLGVMGWDRDAYDDLTLESIENKMIDCHCLTTTSSLGFSCIKAGYYTVGSVRAGYYA